MPIDFRKNCVIFAPEMIINCAMKLDKTALNKLRKELKGHQKDVAKIAGVDRSTVSRVLDGEIYNEHVIYRCIEIRDRERAKKQKIKEAINS